MSLVASRALRFPDPPAARAVRPAGSGNARPPLSCDAALVSGLRAGEEAAFEFLVRTYRRRLLAVACRLLHDPEEARDAVQDTFLLAFRAIDSFLEGARLSPWLHRILVNVSISRLRARRPTAPLEEALLEPSACRSHEPHESAVLRRETRALVQRCILQLPNVYRTAVELRYLRGLDTLEIARLMGVTPNAVKGRLHRARLRMRVLLSLQPRGGGGSSGASREMHAQRTAPGRPCSGPRTDAARRREAIENA